MEYVSSGMLASEVWSILPDTAKMFSKMPVPIPIFTKSEYK